MAAFPGDADQAAVSGAWTSYFNAMAAAAQNAITTEASAYQAYINGMAADIQTTMNNIAGEATALAGSYGAAVVNLISTVGAAATLHTSQSAAAGVVWVDTVATDVKNSEKAAANAWLVMADAGVDAVKNLADDFSNHWNSFAHNYLAAAAAHGTNVINEDRLAARNMDSELTTLAQGVAAEQHDLNLDALVEWLSAALALSPLDDVLVNAWAVMESAWSIFYASDTHATTAAAPLGDFASSYASGASPMSGINHTFDLAANDDEIAMQAALAALAANLRSMSEPPVTAVPGVFSSSYHLNDSYFRNNLLGIPCVVCHGVTAQGIVGPPSSFRFPGGAGVLEQYGNLRDTAASGVTAVGIAGGSYLGFALLTPASGSGTLLSFTPAQLAGRYGLTVARVNTIVNGYLTRGAAIVYSPETASALLAYRLIAMRAIEKYQQSGSPSVVGMQTQFLRIQMIEQQLSQWGVPF